MKNKIINVAIAVMLVVLVLVIIGGAFYLGFFDPKISDEEKILNISADGACMTAVTDSGNVYLDGYISHDYNYGLGRPFPNGVVDYARIYDKQDAVYVDINDCGGCIITDKSDVYIFLNGSEEYRVPTYFCSGYIKASVADDNVYLLTEDGSLGYVNVYSPDVFHLIGDSIVDFELECSNDSVDKYKYFILLALTEDDCLYVLEEGEKAAECERYLDGIIDFDTVSFISDLPKDSDFRKYCEIGLIDTERQAYWYEGYLDEDYGKIADIDNYTLTGKDKEKVLSFKRGVAMLNKADEVALYGYDFGNSDTFSGETVFYDVKSVFTGPWNLIVQYNDGNIDYYGYKFHEGSTKYIR